MKKPKKNFKFALKKALRLKMDINLPRHEIELEENPLLILGKLLHFYHCFRVWNECILQDYKVDVVYDVLDLYC